MISKFLGVLLGCAMLAGSIGCGGSSSSAAVPTPTPTPVSGTATVSASASAIPLGSTQLFTASNFSGTVTWSLNPAVGTINSSTGVYTAPATFPSPNTFTVTATAGSQTASTNASIVYPNDNSTNQATPVKLGTSGGNTTDLSANACCIGTMGSLWTRADLAFPVILSNNHVLDKSSFGTPGQTIDQPGPSACFPSSAKLIATLTQGAALAPAGTATGRTGPSPSNTDSAIAQITAGAVDPTGSILDLGAAGSTSIAAQPPSSTLATAAIGLAVAKSGRTTGLTCSTVTSINASIVVAYDSSCGGTTAFNATYSGQVVISGGSFSAGGDSGSLVVTQANARPVALLYGGSATDTVANPIQDVIAALSNGAGNTLTIVGGGDHAVSCQPTAASSNSIGGNGTDATTVPVTASERQHVMTVQAKNSRALMQDSAIKSLSVAGSADNPSEGALLIHLSRASSTPIPAVIDGVRTRVVYDAASGMLPSVGQAQIDHASAVKEAHASEYMGQPGIQGIGVSISSDNPAETAISIYVIKGVSHQIIPPVIDGIRTKVFEGERFRAF